MPPKKPVAAKAPVKAAAKPAPRPAAGRGTTPAAKKGAVAPGNGYKLYFYNTNSTYCQMLYKIKSRIHIDKYWGHFDDTRLHEWLA